MKLVKNFVFTALLVSALAFNTFAGDIDLPGAPKPATSSDDVSTPVTTATDTQQTSDLTADTSDYLFYEALAALLSVY